MVLFHLGAVISPNTCYDDSMCTGNNLGTTLDPVACCNDAEFAGSMGILTADGTCLSCLTVGKQSIIIASMYPATALGRVNACIWLHHQPTLPAHSGWNPVTCHFNSRKNYIIVLTSIILLVHCSCAVSVWWSVTLAGKRHRKTGVWFVAF